DLSLRKNRECSCLEGLIGICVDHPEVVLFGWASIGTARAAEDHMAAVRHPGRIMHILKPACDFDWLAALIEGQLQCGTEVGVWVFRPEGQPLSVGRESWTKAESSSEFFLIAGGRGRP